MSMYSICRATHASSVQLHITIVSSHALFSIWQSNQGQLEGTVAAEIAAVLGVPSQQIAVTATLIGNSAQLAITVYPDASGTIASPSYISQRVNDQLYAAQNSLFSQNNMTRGVAISQNASTSTAEVVKCTPDGSGLYVSVNVCPVTATGTDSPSRSTSSSSSIPPWGIVLIVLACLAVCLGVICLALALKNRQEEEKQQPEPVPELTAVATGPGPSPQNNTVTHAARWHWDEHTTTQN